MPQEAIDVDVSNAVQSILGGPQHPEKMFAEGSATYSAVYEMAACLCRQFGRTGNERPVCLCTGDKAVLAAALIASLAGGPAMILPHAASPQALGELHDLTGFELVVTDRAFGVPEGVQCLIPQRGLNNWPPDEQLKPKTGETEWIRLFTGGSTGTPKMWTKTVRNLLAETVSIIGHYAVTERDRIVATVSPNHIYGLLYAILTPLLAAASVVDATPSFPSEIEQAIRKMDATILVSVPAHFRALKGHPFRAPGMRLAFSSAGLLAAEDAMAFSAQTGVAIAEIYGSTETGGIASRVRANGESDFKPYGNIRVRVDGDTLQVASAYLSPELERDADGYFAMGDRAVETGDGRFTLLGRVDGVVKVGGRRVDLEAVKERLMVQPGVMDAVVIALPVGKGRENQIAALVTGAVDADGLNRALTSALEPYARPRLIKVVAAIPHTAAGKYDRKAIEKMFNDL